MNSLWKTAGARFLLPLLVVMVAGCQRPAASPVAEGATSGSAPPSTQAAPTVTTVKPVRKTFNHRIEQPGEIQALEQTPMYARISGYVKTVLKDIGDPMSKDEVLAELSVPERDEELQQKKALVDQAGAEVEQAKRLFDAAEANVKSAGAKENEVAAARLRASAESRRAASQYARLKNSSGVIAEESIEETKLGAEAARAVVTEVDARIKSAEAARIEAEARRDKARADIRVAEARLRVAQADERREAAMLGYAKLRAPYAGFVIRRNVDPGHLLQSGAGGVKGEPVFVVARTDTVRIFVDVPENDAVLVSNATPAVVTIGALEGEQFKGTVTRSAWALDPKGRTLRTEIDIKNPGGRLRPGMYAYAVITVEHSNVLALPASAVVTQGEQTFCFRLEGGKAVRTPILVGLRDGQFVEVVKKRGPGKDGDWEPVTGDEEFIVGAAALTDGQTVAVARNP